MTYKLHKRYRIVTGASIELGKAVSEIVDKHDLTFAELNKILLEEAVRWNKYAIREERHPDDPDKKGDVE